MRSNYKKLGQFIKEVSVKNKDLSVELLLGVSITKQFIPSIANTVGTDMSKYKVVEHHQFAYGPVTSRNGEKISVALLSEEKCIVSTSYTVFEIVDTELLDPEYLMMWFRRSEFDRYARYMSHGTVRELFGWQEMCDVELPVPSIEKQREIVREYNVVNDRIALNEQLTQKLEDTAQTIYKQWFVDFEFPISKEYAESIGKPELEGKPYKSSGGEMAICEESGTEIPSNWNNEALSDLARGDRPITYGVLKPDGFVQEGIKFVRGGDIVDGRVSFDGLKNISESVSNKYKRTIIKGGEILIVLVGSPGLVAIAPESLKGANVYRQIGVVDIECKDTTQYVRTFLVSPYGQNALNNLISGSVQQVINLEKLRGMNILVPDNATVRFFGKLSSPLQSKIETTDLITSALKKTKEILLAGLSRMP